jgi:hypothetical protein
MKTIAFLLLCCTLVCAHADEPEPGHLSGSYRFHGQTVIDPPPGENADSHMGLVLQGAAARELYQRLSVTAEPDICLDDGSLRKTQGGIHCIQLAGSGGWRCEFAIRLDTQTLVPDGAC